MKRTLILLLVLISVSGITLYGQKTSKVSNAVKIKVYYFHPEERCPIDQSIEENTKKVIHSNFQDKVKSGVIDFRVINTDDKANAKLISNFDINAQALYLVKVDKGKEIKNDMTKFAFDFGLSNPMKFKKGLKDEIDKDLK